jgi:hypothetical protein
VAARIRFGGELFAHEFGKTLDPPVQEEVKEVLARGRRLLESEDTSVLQEAISSVQMVARHLTTVMLMDPTQLLRTKDPGSGSSSSDGPSGTQPKQ